MDRNETIKRIMENTEYTIKLEKRRDGKYYVLHGTGPAGLASDFFITKNLAINWMDRLRGSLESKGVNVVMILPPGSLA